MGPDQAGQMSVLACVQTVCKDNQQITQADKELKIRSKDSCHNSKRDHFSKVVLT